MERLCEIYVAFFVFGSFRVFIHTDARYFLSLILVSEDDVADDDDIDNDDVDYCEMPAW